MIASTTTRCLLTLLFALTAACSQSEDVTTPATTKPPGANAVPLRRLVDAHALSTSPTNLLADPGFSFANSQEGGFFVFYEDDFAQGDLGTTLDSRSPAGFASNVGILRPSGASNTVSKRMMLMASFLGGNGPFHAQVWISKSDTADGPTDLATDAVRVTVADGDPQAASAFDLEAVDADTRKIGGRTWVHFRADVPKSLTGPFFVVHGGTTGGNLEVAAPEVTSDELKAGAAVRALTFPTTARSLTWAERRAIALYRAVPPRLMPAGARPGAPAN